MKNIKNYTLHTLVIALALSASPMRAAQKPSASWWKKLIQSPKKAHIKLMEGINANNGKLVEEALQEGADANKFDQYGFTPLSKAVYYNSLPLAKTLLEHGAQPSVNTPSRDGDTPLSKAVHHNNIPLIRLLLSYGAQDSVNIPHKRGTPLLDAVDYNNTPLAELLLAHGAEPNMPNKHGKTPLFAAVSHDNMPLVELLLSHGATLGTHTRLPAAAPQIHNLLKITGAIAATDEERATIINKLSVAERLHIAPIVRARLQLHNRKLTLQEVQLLAALGNQKSLAILKELNKEIAQERGMPADVTQLFMEYENPLHQEKRPRAVEESLSKNLDDSFMRSFWTGNSNAVTAMIDKIDINAHAPNQGNMTPLIMAAAQGHIYIVQLLLDNGANTIATDDEGNTALAMAIRNGHVDVVRTLFTHAEQHNQMDILLKATDIQKELSQADPDNRAQMEKVIGHYIHLTGDKS